jgi:hypothetical protein
VNLMTMNQETQTTASRYTRPLVDWRTNILLVTPAGAEFDGGPLADWDDTEGTNLSEAAAQVMSDMGYREWFVTGGMAIYTGGTRPEAHAYRLFQNRWRQACCSAIMHAYLEGQGNRCECWLEAMHAFQMHMWVHHRGPD